MSYYLTLTSPLTQDNLMLSNSVEETESGLFVLLQFLEYIIFILANTRKLLYYRFSQRSVSINQANSSRGRKYRQSNVQISSFIFRSPYCFLTSMPVTGCHTQMSFYGKSNPLTGFVTLSKTYPFLRQFLLFLLLSFSFLYKLL